MSAVRRLPICLLALLVFLLLCPLPALAHAHLVRADLTPGGHLTLPGGVVHFWFDEPLNGPLSKVLIDDAQGRQVNTDTGSLDARNSQELDLTLPPLAAGVYSVFWTSSSAQDGHVLHDFYTFTAGGPGAQRLGLAPSVLSGSGAPSLDGSGLASGLAHWLVLLAATLWTGALAFELLVLAPLRRRADGPLAALSLRASERGLALIQAGLLGTLLASVIELESQAHAAGGGLFSFDVLRDLLHSHYGAFWLARLAAIFLAQVALLLIPADASGRPRLMNDQRLPRLALPAAGVVSAGYLLATVLSGHADAVAQITASSVLLDWLHLLASSLWIGGMATIALVLLPAFQTTSAPGSGSGYETRLAFLTVLNRYSPVAFAAVPVAMVTGIFNAQVHLSSFDQFLTLPYGRLLMIKLGLIALLLLISASHVFHTRPRLRHAIAGQGHAAPSDQDVAPAGFPSLTCRLRLEPLLGACVLLCVALMAQTAPAVTVFAIPTAASSIPTRPSAPAPPAPISASASLGSLTVALTINQPVVGRATMFVVVRSRGRLVLDGQVRVKLSRPQESSLGAAFVETIPSGGGYTGRGDLARNGLWQADVLVRTRDDPLEYRELPLQFVVGPGAAFLPAGLDPAAIGIALRPGVISASNTLTLSRLPADAVQVLSDSLDMSMGAEAVPMKSLGHGVWRATGLYAPMEGRWALTVQIRSGGSWTTIRRFIYQVPLSGPIRLQGGGQSAGVPGPTPTPRPAAGVALHSAGFGAALATTLPYTVVVTEMGSNGIRLLGKPLLHTGTQAHGVDVLDGTPYAYVTNFGADPGTVSQVDLRSMRVLRTYTVGLGPAHIVFLPGRREVVTNFRSNDLSLIDAGTGTVSRVAFPSDTCFQPHGIDLSEDGRTIYVACGGGSWIYPVDSRTLRPGRPIITAPGAFGVAVDAARHEVWVTNQTASSVSVVDERSGSLLATFPVGKGPALLTVSADGRTVYVANQQANTLSVVDAARRVVTAVIPVAAQPHGLDLTGDGKYLYVASVGAGVVTIIRTADHAVVAVVAAPIGANEVAVAR